MKKQVKKLVKWVKKQDIRGCLTGSCLLDYFEGQDVDVFCYDENSFKYFIHKLEHDKNFQLVDPLEKWKYKKENDAYNNKRGFVTTIKFKYNTCIDLNIIYKPQANNIFSVLATFDMDIIAKGYDLQTGKTLDLKEKNNSKKIATWNKWNTSFYSFELWEMSRILRQLDRCFKYYKRGYNTDKVVKKYISIIDEIQNFQNSFNSDSFTEKLKIKQQNTKIIKKICKKWLETHKITDEEIELLKIKIKEI